MKKQLQLFFVGADEAVLSEELRCLRSAILFIDDNVWAGTEPVVQVTIERCASRFVYLWDRDLVPTLPTLRRRDGKYEGPVAGVVIQFIRSQCQDDRLLSGRVAVGIGGNVDIQVQAGMRRFAADVWKTIQRLTCPVVTATPETGEVGRSKVTDYRVGLHAIKWLAADDGRLLRDRSTDCYYVPSPNR